MWTLQSCAVYFDRMVNVCLAEELKEIHAIEQKTLTPEQWEKQKSQWHIHIISHSLQCKNIDYWICHVLLCRKNTSRLISCKPTCSYSIYSDDNKTLKCCILTVVFVCLGSQTLIISRNIGSMSFNTVPHLVNHLSIFYHLSCYGSWAGGWAGLEPISASLGQGRVSLDKLLVPRRADI